MVEETIVLNWSRKNAGGQFFRYKSNTYSREDMFAAVRSGKNLEFIGMCNFDQHLHILRKMEPLLASEDLDLVKRIIMEGGFIKYISKLEKQSNGN